MSATEASFSTTSFRTSRPSIVGPNEPESPFPVKLFGPVQKGFGRGGKDLGCPTANLPDDALEPLSSVTSTGIYYGYAQISPSSSSTPSSTDISTQKLRPEDFKVLPMVMSLGYNPFYKNKQLTAEVHIMHDFPADFYGNDMKVLVLGYIRPELDYTSREGLIEDIDTDKRVALTSLERPAYKVFATDLFFTLAANSKPDSE